MKHYLIIFILFFVFVIDSTGYSQNVHPARVTPAVRIFKKVSPAVVNISTERVVLLNKNPYWKNQGQALDKIYQNQPAQAQKIPSLGSGVIIDQEGLILTNAHVVDRAASTIFVTLFNGQKLPAKLIGVNRPNDLAVIKIEPPFPLTLIELANSDQLLIGEPVIAIGNPYGLSSTITTGVVSANKRTLVTPQGQVILKNVIQTDAAINPGSSGGALVNIEGKLIGINQIVAQEAQGISFAIPSNIIKQILPEFMKYYRAHKNEEKIEPAEEK